MRFGRRGKISTLAWLDRPVTRGKVRFVVDDQALPTRRPAAQAKGGQAQFIARPVQGDGDPLSGLLAWARQHLTEDLSIERFAEKAGMSRRTFIRRFETATDMAPGEWLLQERLAAARALLESTQTPIESVATATGFGSAEAMRHHFRLPLQTSPQRYRASFTPAIQNA